MLMLSLYLISADGDTLERSREEIAKFAASQCILGCAAYPVATAIFVGAYTENWDYAGCTGLMTPLACLTASGVYALSSPIKKPMAAASFTGAIDGALWSLLIYGNIVFWGNYYDDGEKLFSTLILFGLSGGNLAGLYSGYLGGSEGAYILKTYSAFYVPYTYFQAKRLILGNFAGNYSEDEFKVDLSIAMALSIGGGLGTYYLTKDNYEITGGDAIFIGANVIKGAVILETPIKLVYINTNPISQDFNPMLFSGAFVYYDDPIYDRLSAAAYLSGMALGAYISYKIAKKKDLNILEGLVYSTVPIFAYYAGMAPWIVLREDYYRIMPLVQVSFDVGASYLLYKLF
ncbi:MAG: hypothetical protein ABIL16_02555 [candidate division WOR-3 bacterium]